MEGCINSRVAKNEDKNIIKGLYWLLDTDAIYYQPELFLRNPRPD